MADDQWPPASGLPARSRMKPAKSLEWGETPFDDLTRAELLRLVQAYHMALGSTSSCLRMAQALNPTSPYWGHDGSGGLALARAEILMKLAGDGGADQGSERIYRSFFRVAEPLLFPTIPDRDGFSRWGVNDKGEWCAPYDPARGYRKVEWRDLLPVKDAA